MNRCRSCLVPDTRPDTAFYDGECSACVNYRNRVNINWAARREIFEAALERGRNGSGFDCIVPSSGGKDSHYQVLKLIELGARPLVVTASTDYLTPLGRKNIDNLARYATTIEFNLNREVRRKLNVFGLETVGDISYPEHMAIFSVPFRAAVQFGIPLIIYGESPQQEYGCPSGAEEALFMTRRWVHEFGGLLGMRANDCIGYDGITELDMKDYVLPDDTMLDGVTALFLGQFFPWDSHANAVAAAKAGMHYALPSPANLWPHENLDNAMTGLHDHQCYRKYGFGRYTAQMSVDLRHGIERDRAKAHDLVQRNDGLFPFNYAGVSLHDVLKHLGISELHLLNALDKFTNWDLFSGNVNYRPTLKSLSAAA